MAIKANASSQGGSEFKKYVGVGSFRVMGVNPTKEELSAFFGRVIDKDPVYLTDKTDPNDNNKPYKQLRVTFLLQADLEYEDNKPIKENAVLKEPLKTSVTFFLQNRYFYNRDKTKVQVIDKYGRTAWVTIEQAKNHQIPVYKNGPAKLDKDYHPAFIGEDALTQFTLNYLNVTPVETYNTNTGQWIPNPNPDDCEGNLYKITDYFKGDISELKENATMMPFNRIKMCVGVQTNDQGQQYITVYSGISMRNGAKSYTRVKDTIAGDTSDSVKNTVFTMDTAGNITNLVEYKENVKETDFSGSDTFDDPFKAGAALPDDDLPFGNANESDPFSGVA